MSARENLLIARCSPALFSKVLAARKIIFLAARARKIKLE